MNGEWNNENKTEERIFNREFVCDEINKVIEFY